MADEEEDELPGSGTKGPRNPARNTPAFDKALKALELRKTGYGLTQIARNLGYESAASAQKAIQSALRHASGETPDHVRQIELERLDTVLMRCFQCMMTVYQPKLTTKDANGNPVQQDNPHFQDWDLMFKAMDRILMINVRRSKLMGLEIPPQTAVLMAEYQKLFDQFAKLVQEVGGLIVKEAPPDVAQKILVKIAAFQSATAAPTMNAISAAQAAATGGLSETALNITQINLHATPPPPLKRAPVLDAEELQKAVLANQLPPHVAPLSADEARDLRAGTRILDPKLDAEAEVDSAPESIDSPESAADSTAEELG